MNLPMGLISSVSFNRDQLNSFFKCVDEARKSILRPDSSLPDVRGAVGILLFLEPSTRTRISFEMAGLSLGLRWIQMGTEGSSLQKGESLKDTLLTLKANRPRVIVLRSPDYGLAHWAQRWTGLPIINAGEGWRDHPTQGLIDAYCLRQLKRSALKICFFGDALRSRVFRSDAHFFSLMGHTLFLCDDGSDEQKALAEAFKLAILPRERLKHMDIVVGLRVQRERGSLRRQEPLDLQDLGSKTLVMHPGPALIDSDFSRALALGMEQDPERHLIHKQVENGLYVRRALLAACLGRSEA